MPILKGLWALIAVIVLSAFIISMVLGVTLYTAALVIALVIFAPILGILVVVFLPLPMFVKATIALAVSILAVVYGLQHLGVL